VICRIAAQNESTRVIPQQKERCCAAAMAPDAGAAGALLAAHGAGKGQKTLVSP
jgi:hypothetical protein